MQLTVEQLRRRDLSKAPVQTAESLRVYETDAGPADELPVKADTQPFWRRPAVLAVGGAALLLAAGAAVVWSSSRSSGKTKAARRGK